MMTYDELIKNIHILIADDDEDYLSMTYNFLKQIGYNVDTATNGREALLKLAQKEYQILLLDFFMPELNGEEVVREIRKTDQELIIILQTGFSGQKPPIETMQKLNIQNYHDKTEGIDRLNLELISAVKIYNQQSEIEFTRYKTNAIGGLVASVAQEIKSNLLSVGAGLEATNMLVEEAQTAISKENVENLKKFYERNKNSLERIDKVLTSIIGQASNNSNYVMTDADIMDIIGLVLVSESRTLDVKINLKLALKSNSYITGSINDTIYIVCEILKKLMYLHEKNTSIDLVLSEDEAYWYFRIYSDKVSKIGDGDFYLLKKVIFSIRNTSIEREDDVITIAMDKTIEA